jgi:hypothetical protein
VLSPARLQATFSWLIRSSHGRQNADRTVDGRGPWSDAFASVFDVHEPERMLMAAPSSVSIMRFACSYDRIGNRKYAIGPFACVNMDGHNRTTNNTS